MNNCVQCFYIRKVIRIVSKVQTCLYLKKDEAHFIIAQPFELMTETNSRKQLRRSGKPFFNARHINKDKSELILVIEISYFLQSFDVKPVGFINNY